MKTVILCLSVLFWITILTKAVEIVPGHRQVIRTNGATHTISRYFVIPESHAKNEAHEQRTITDNGEADDFDYDNLKAHRKIHQSIGQHIDRNVDVHNRKTAKTVHYFNSAQTNLENKEKLRSSVHDENENPSNIKKHYYYKIRYLNGNQKNSNPNFEANSLNDVTRPNMEVDVQTISERERNQLLPSLVPVDESNSNNNAAMYDGNDNEFIDTYDNGIKRANAAEMAPIYNKETTVENYRSNVNKNLDFEPENSEQNRKYLQKTMKNHDAEMVPIHNKETIVENFRSDVNKNLDLESQNSERNMKYSQETLKKQDVEMAPIHNKETTVEIFRSDVNKNLDLEPENSEQNMKYSQETLNNRDPIIKRVCEASSQNIEDFWKVVDIYPGREDAEEYLSGTEKIYSLLTILTKLRIAYDSGLPIKQIVDDIINAVPLLFKLNDEVSEEISINYDNKINNLRDSCKNWSDKCRNTLTKLKKTSKNLNGAIAIAPNVRDNINSSENIFLGNNTKNIDIESVLTVVKNENNDTKNDKLIPQKNRYDSADNLRVLDGNVSGSQFRSEEEIAGKYLSNYEEPTLHLNESPNIKNESRAFSDANRLEDDTKSKEYNLISIESIGKNLVELHNKTLLEKTDSLNREAINLSAFDTLNNSTTIAFVENSNGDKEIKIPDLNIFNVSDDTQFELSDVIDKHMPINRVESNQTFQGNKNVNKQILNNFTRNNEDDEKYIEVKVTLADKNSMELVVDDETAPINTTILSVLEYILERIAIAAAKIDEYLPNDIQSNDLDKNATSTGPKTLHSKSNIISGLSVAFKDVFNASKLVDKYLPDYLKSGNVDKTSTTKTQLIFLKPNILRSLNDASDGITAVKYLVRILLSDKTEYKMPEETLFLRQIGLTEAKNKILEDLENALQFISTTVKLLTSLILESSTSDSLDKTESSSLYEESRSISQMKEDKYSSLINDFIPMSGGKSSDKVDIKPQENLDQIYSARDNDKLTKALIRDVELNYALETEYPKFKNTTKKSDHETLFDKTIGFAKQDKEAQPDHTIEIQHSSRSKAEDLKGDNYISASKNWQKQLNTQPLHEIAYQHQKAEVNSYLDSIHKIPSSAEDEFQIKEEERVHLNIPNSVTLPDASDLVNKSEISDQNFYENVKPNKANVDLSDSTNKMPAHIEKDKDPVLEILNEAKYSLRDPKDLNRDSQKQLRVPELHNPDRKITSLNQKVNTNLEKLEDNAKKAIDNSFVNTENKLIIHGGVNADKYDAKHQLLDRNSVVITNDSIIDSDKINVLEEDKMSSPFESTNHKSTSLNEILSTFNKSENNRESQVRSKILYDLKYALENLSDAAYIVDRITPVNSKSATSEETKPITENRLNNIKLKTLHGLNFASEIISEAVDLVEKMPEVPKMENTVLLNRDSNEEPVQHILRNKPTSSAAIQEKQNNSSRPHLKFKFLAFRQSHEKPLFKKISHQQQEIKSIDMPLLLQRILNLEKQSQSSVVDSERRCFKNRFNRR